MILMWLSFISLCSVRYILESYTKSRTLVLVLEYIFGITMSIGLGNFQVNIIQFGVDQLLDSSSSDIISYITWYVWGFYLSKVVIGYTYCIPLITDLLLAVLLTLALCSDFLFSYWLSRNL